MQILYSFQNLILTQNIAGDRQTRSLVLCNDYGHSLCYLTYKDEIIYAYVTRLNQIVVRNASKGQTLFVEKAKYANAKRLLELCEFAGNVLLFFCEDISEEAYDLCFSVVEGNEKRGRLPLHLPLPTEIMLAQGKHNIYLELSGCEKEEKPRLYRISEDFIFEAMPEKESLIASKREIEHLKKQIMSATSQYNELMQVAEQYREEAIKWRNKFI